MRKLIVTWIIIADSHKALLFKKTNEQTSEPTLIHTLEAQLDIFHSHPGRTFNSTGNLRHAVEPHTDPRELEKLDFAHDIYEMLDDVNKHSQLDNLVIIAPPKLIGMIDNDLDKQIHKKLTHKVSKDIMNLQIHEMQAYINDVLKTEPK